MNILDSSAWLEYFCGSKTGEQFAKIVKSPATLIVPTIIIYEVFKKLLVETNEKTALETIGQLKQCKIIGMDLNIALLAAQISQKHKLPMADSIILASARSHNATLFTLDSDFKNIEGVKYFSGN